MLAEVCRMDAYKIKGLGPAVDQHPLFPASEHCTAFQPAIVRGYNALTGANAELRRWDEYLAGYAAGPDDVLPDPNVTVCAHREDSRSARMPRVPWRTMLSRAFTAFTVRRALWHVAGANDIRVAGNYGVVVGSIDDRAILEKYAETGTWCPLETHFFMDFFARAGKGTYLDIGANIGLTTIPVASNPAVVCFAVEPDPTNFAYLQENVRRNCRGGNVRLLQTALLDRVATLELRISPTNKGDLRLRIGSSGCAADDADWPTIEVKAGRLDDIGIDQHILPPLAAKVVAQGSEFHVLSGGHRILSAAGSPHC